MRTWIISFEDKPRHDFRLFSSSHTARLITRALTPTLCTCCRGFHYRQNCRRKARCRRCGSTEHTNECCNEDAPKKCINCRGPHEATSKTWPARSFQKNGKLIKLTKAEMAQATEHGELLCQRANRR
ncbi:hypothetical protein LRP88_12681 [Fusarium phalaenopsidis]